MSDEQPSADGSADPAAIEERIERVERIIERLETEELAIAEATRLRDDARELLADVEADLDVGDGSVIERDS